MFGGGYCVLRITDVQLVFRSSGLRLLVKDQDALPREAVVPQPSRARGVVDGRCAANGDSSLVSPQTNAHTKSLNRMYVKILEKNQSFILTKLRSFEGTLEIMFLYSSTLGAVE